jgi:single-strand DNA-binding protein
MASYNKVILMGNLTRDPEKRYLDSGTAVTSLSIAVNRRYKKQEQWVDEVSFFDIVTFGSQAENCAKFLAKGRPILVEGELRQRRWEAQDGTKRSKVEVNANIVQFLGPRPEGAGQGTPEEAGDDVPPPIDNDDIPF